MKKVSEVQRELSTLGCHEEQAKDLLIACGILENDKVETVKPLQIWYDKCTNQYQVVAYIDYKSDSVSTHSFPPISGGSYSPFNYWISIKIFTDNCKLIWPQR